MCATKTYASAIEIPASAIVPTGIGQPSSGVLTLIVDAFREARDAAHCPARAASERRIVQKLSRRAAQPPGQLRCSQALSHSFKGAEKCLVPAKPVLRCTASPLPILFQQSGPLGRNGLTQFGIIIATCWNAGGNAGRCCSLTIASLRTSAFRGSRRGAKPKNGSGCDDRPRYAPSQRQVAGRT